MKSSPTQRSYRMKVVWDHPFSDEQGRVYEHRLVYEAYHKCCLLPNSIVHHIDHDRLNNDISNLEAFPSHSVHMKNNHKPPKIDMSDRVCWICNSKETRFDYRMNAKEWYKFECKWICFRCYKRCQWHINKNRKMLLSMIKQ